MTDDLVARLRALSKEQKRIPPFRVLPVFSIILLMIAFLLHSRYGYGTVLENTFGAGEFFLTYAAIGVGIAIITIILINRIYPLPTPCFYFDKRNRQDTYITLFIAIALLVPGIAAFINSYFAYNPITCTSYTITALRWPTRGGPTLIINLDSGKRENIYVESAIYNQANAGGTVEICTHAGRLGHDVITKVRLVDEATPGMPTC